MTQNAGGDLGSKIGSELAPVLNENLRTNVNHMWSQASNSLDAGGIKGHVSNCLQSRGFSSAGAQQLVQGNLPDAAPDLAMLSKHLNDAQNVFQKLSNINKSMSDTASGIIGNLR
ncbi:MAG TPA: hypothetical protein VER08_00810 [Pyrinomonadaceae bacterium]|nr:hypothetical protein [Pyrinomonadaceae bacterium]